MSLIFHLQKEKAHLPVLVSEILSLFSEEDSPKKILDCTFGRGGHSLALLQKFPNLCITALDWDEQAIQYYSSCQEPGIEKIKLLKENFHHFAKLGLETHIYDMVLMDLGVSSPQLDEQERGFSFYQEGPLDMRMDRDQDFKASDIINNWSKKDLIHLFQTYGEIRKPYKAVEAILKQRKKEKIKSTLELAQLIQKHSFQKSFRKHPATNWFLALRIVVNQELKGLEESLADYIPLLKEQAYFVVISFHSLEDRIVKTQFRKFVEEKKGELWNKKVIRPGFEERKQNPRSRSAKMRVFVKKSH